MTILRAVRRKRKLSGPEVSRRTGISTTNLYRYECRTRKLPVPIAKKLANLYGVRWEMFFEEDGDGAAS